MSRHQRYQDQAQTRISSGICPHDCPDTCAWKVAVDIRKGVALDIWGDDDHPLTKGRLCNKVDRYLERTYHADRLTHPLKRIGPKGSGQFRTIPWEAAIEEIAVRLKRVIASQGEEAILPYSYAGTMGLLQGEGMARRLFHRMGASRLAHTICSVAGQEGYGYTIGRSIGMEAEDFAFARLILIWGSNTLTSNQHLWPFIQLARKEGARVVVIDPVRTRTAKAADEWLPIRPGTDGALALAIIHVIIRDGLYDQEYLDAYCVGFESLAKEVRQYSPEWASDLTGIPSQQITSLAHDYAKANPAAIRINYGLQRHAGGGMAVRNISCLPALVGAWRYRGGGIQLSTSGAFSWNEEQLFRPDLLNGRSPRTINMNRLGDALSQDPESIARAHYRPRPIDRVPRPHEAGPPLSALIVFNANPAAVAPDQAAVLAGLRREDLFTVVLEHFQTDTADFADIVLPATTQLEHWDIVEPYGHLYLGLNQPAISPIGESLPNSEIFRRIATAMHYNDPCLQESDQDFLRHLLGAQTDRVFDGITWERLLVSGHVRLNLPKPFLPFAEGGFDTPSGKCEFYSPRAAADGYNPLPSWSPPQTLQIAMASNPTASVASNPLALISPPAHSFLNSSFANLERFRQREGTPLIIIHPQDAANQGLRTGQRVRIWNELGEMVLTVQISDDIIQGTLVAPSIWWNKYSPDGRNVNQITSQAEVDMGGGASFYDTCVWISPL